MDQSSFYIFFCRLAPMLLSSKYQNASGSVLCILLPIYTHYLSFPSSPKPLDTINVHTDDTKFFISSPELSSELRNLCPKIYMQKLLKISHRPIKLNTYIQNSVPDIQHSPPPIHLLLQSIQIIIWCPDTPVLHVSSA